MRDILLHRLSKEAETVWDVVGDDVLNDQEHNLSFMGSKKGPVTLNAECVRDIVADNFQAHAEKEDVLSWNKLSSEEKTEVLVEAFPDGSEYGR